jgi:V/A-type H+-transporting ATPase subunit A
LYDFRDWYTEKISVVWPDLVSEAMGLLQREVELLEIVQLVGPDALAEVERAELLVARMLREDFLQQSAYHEVDRFCPMEKAYWMLKAIMDFYRRTRAAVEAKVPLDQIAGLDVIAEIARFKEIPVEQAEVQIKNTMERVQSTFTELGVS